MDNSFWATTCTRRKQELLQKNAEIYPDSAEIRKNLLPTAAGAILVRR